MNRPAKSLLCASLASALLLPRLAQAQALTPYALGKAKQYSQTGPGELSANPVAPFQFNAIASIQGTLTTPLSQVDQLTYVIPDASYEVLQNFTTQAAMDQAFPSGTYTFTLFGQLPVNLILTGDLYPSAPQIVGGTWGGGDLLVDPTSDYVLSFNPFLGFATVGEAGQAEFTIQNPPGPDLIDTTWVSITSPVIPAGITIPAGTLTPGSHYTAKLVYASDTVVDDTSVPGALLLSTYATSDTFIIFAASPASVVLVATSQPESQTVANASTVVFTFAASGYPPPSYQWYFNGAQIPDTQPMLVINGATAASAGSYYCTATNANGSLTSNAASLFISGTSDIGRLVNISCRAQVGTGGNILIAGFAVGGAGTAGTEQLLIRGSGPALVPFGVTGALADPQLQIFSGSELLGTNDGWNGSPAIASAASSVGAFAWPIASSHDAALLENLPGGPYTAQVAGEASDSGVALAEVYDDTQPGARTPTTPRLVNISARVQVGTGGNILIAGFVIGGSTSKTVLIRASGPALIEFGVLGTLPDPMLQLYSGGTVVAASDGWGGNPQIASAAASVGAFAWSNPASNDSAILVTLPPGAYTAQVAGASGDSGVALAEVYEVP